MQRLRGRAASERTRPNLSCEICVVEAGAAVKMDQDRFAVVCGQHGLIVGLEAVAGAVSVWWPLLPSYCGY